MKDQTIFLVIISFFVILALVSAPASVAAGTITAFAGGRVPSGYLLCDGRSMSKTKYARLFAVIGDTYGDESTTFNLPDLTNRFPIGAGDDYTLGSTGGNTSVALPPHVHGLSSITVSSGSGTNVASISGGTGGVTGSPTINVLNPYLGVNYIIKF